MIDHKNRYLNTSVSTNMLIKSKHIEVNGLPGLLTDSEIKKLCYREIPVAPKKIRYKNSSSSKAELARRKMASYEIEMARHNDFKPMIYPFIGESVNTTTKTPEGKPCKMTRVISYGLSSAGYDVRLSNEFKIFSNLNNSLIDPLNMPDDCYHEVTASRIVLPPHSYALGVTKETFRIPRDVLVIALGKSTYARCGLIVNVTPIEPGFEGQVVIEIANTTSLPAVVYAEQGISQFLFFRTTGGCNVSYADRNGKYQNQTGVTTARK